MVRRRAADWSYWLLIGSSAVVLFSPRAPSEAGAIGLDKVVHVLLFGALAAATAARFGRGLGWVLLYGVVSEVLQSVLPIHRDGGVWDAAADTLGAVVGWWLVRSVAGRHRGGA